MNGRICWGIYRERPHSPGREFDDAEILRLTGKHLEAQGLQVSLKTPEEVVGSSAPCPPCIFLMCERLEILDQLRRWEPRGVCLVNAPSSVLNTYRDRMVSLFEQKGISFPPSRLVSTASNSRQSQPVWVKRADVHSTQEGDVVFAPTADKATQALSQLAGRGIPQAVIQEHVPGDLIKFYGIGDSILVPGWQPWFRWFYHKDQQLAGHRFDQTALASSAQKAATVLGLEIYGGDAIVTEKGAVVLIDLNAWPSFALFRDEASDRIASYLAARFAEAGT